MSRAWVYLMYHELELQGRPLCQSEPGYTRYAIKAEAFQQQIDYLKRENYSGLSVTQAATGTGDKKTVVITFDDGCETDLLVAAPILEKANFGATFYITTGFLGQPGYLSPAQVRELARYPNFDIGSHSLTHPYLTDLEKPDLQRELCQSKQKLEEIIHRPVTHFSCPGGRWNLRVAGLAKSCGYETVATSRIGTNTSRTDPFRLARVAVTREISMGHFQRICQGQGFGPLQLRELARSSIKRALGNQAYDRLRSLLLNRTSHG